ncbi:MAG: PKD domain-containing protein, partial [Verrucomicrobiales bacterium]|nr:PKD domain-containing protein [Verrucomicrobiales bacterium]
MHALRMVSSGTTVLTLAWLAMVLFGSQAPAQEGVEVIPILQFREAYAIPSEDGKGQSCGAYLKGTFPVYRDRTNLADYTLNITGLAGWSGIRKWDVDRPEVGGSFEFTATFCGCSGPLTGCKDCGQYLGCWADLPPWTATIRRLSPYASFTAKPQATPGVWNFQSTSTDPEEQPTTEHWDFGDGETSSSAGVVHRYAKPGRYSVSLLVTDSDGMTSRAGQPILVPAPAPAIS